MAEQLREFVRLGRQRGVLYELEYVAMVRHTLSETLMDTVLADILLSLLFGEKPPSHCIKRALAVFSSIAYTQIECGKWTKICRRVQTRNSVELAQNMTHEAPAASFMEHVAFGNCDPQLLRVRRHARHVT